MSQYIPLIVDDTGQVKSLASATDFHRLAWIDLVKHELEHGHIAKLYITPGHPIYTIILEAAYSYTNIPSKNLRGHAAGFVSALTFVLTKRQALSGGAFEQLWPDLHEWIINNAIEYNKQYI